VEAADGNQSLNLLHIQKKHGIVGVNERGVLWSRNLR
jgi:hypothetical protein